MNIRYVIHWVVTVIPLVTVLVMILLLGVGWTVPTTVSLGFVFVAYVIAALGFNLNHPSRVAPVLRISLAYVALLHLLIQGVLSAAWVVFAPWGAQFQIAAHVLCLGAGLAVFLMTYSSNTSVAEKVEQQAADVARLRDLEHSLENLASFAPASFRTQISDLLEAVRYQPKQSLQGMELIDAGIIQSVDLLEQFIMDRSDEQVIEAQIQATQSGLIRRRQFLRSNQTGA